MGRRRGMVAALACLTGALGSATGAAPEPEPCAPVVIKHAGSYGGCYRSTDPRVPAVMIKTTEPVRVDGARIEHAGEGIGADVDRVRLTVVDSTLTALDPGTPDPVSQRAIALWSPAALVVSHSRLALGHGIWLGSDADSVTHRLKIVFNESIDVGRYGHPTRPNCCVQFVQLDHVVAGGEIAWNRTRNRAGRSSIEDNVNLYGAEGLGRRAPMLVHHNMIDGAYPEHGDGRGYTGGGIMINDGGGAYVVARQNSVVSTTNYGISIAGGHDSHITGNRVLSDGRDQEGQPVGPEYGVGVAVWDASETGGMTDVTASGNVIGWRRGTDLSRNDWWTPACDPRRTCRRNHSVRGPVTARDERQVQVDWAALVERRGHTIGPR